MHLVVISGRSGSGKSSALQLLEDIGYSCVDNLPISLLPALISQVGQSPQSHSQQFAVGIDARNLGGDLDRFPEILEHIQSGNTLCTVVYLDASDSVLIKRFSETRRKHPLTNKSVGLKEAIKNESAILKPIAERADCTIETSTLTIHELRRVVRKAITQADTEGMALMFESFGFKYGSPIDADFIFDMRSLPNPHWRADLRDHTGLEAPVANFLREQPEVNEMCDDIASFLQKWIPSFQNNNRSYLTIAIGCTGGRHRSVYVTERLAQFFTGQFDNVQTRHRQLIQADGKSQPPAENG